MRKRTWLALSLVAVITLLASGCGKSDKGSTSTGGTLAAGEAPGTGGKAVGFIMVGAKDDFGYNQAVFQGSKAVGDKFKDLKVVTSENVPEDSSAVRVMEDMITKDGAKIIFATSYGHYKAAVEVAKDHPDVVVVHQGGLVEDNLPNFGTYFGTVYEPVYLAGIAAGAATKTNKLGYIYAVPIPQTLANINAFQLGAKSVNPAVETIAVQTNGWCDPPTQATAAQQLIGQGADVITQHQDCTKTIIETTEAAGKYTVGYHADASSLAPKGWLAGSEWNWGPLYTDIVQTAVDGKFTGSKYNADFRQGMKDGSNPFIQSKFGPSVTPETQKKIAEAKAKLEAGGSPFTGPILAQDGSTKVPAGTTPPVTDIESMDYFVQGVSGTISQ
jgi:simple sugar transport system substrate-binding protein/basic membrane protein A